MQKREEQVLEIYKRHAELSSVRRNASTSRSNNVSSRKKSFKSPVELIPLSLDWGDEGAVRGDAEDMVLSATDSTAGKQVGSAVCSGDDEEMSSRKEGVSSDPN